MSSSHSENRPRRIVSLVSRYWYPVKDYFGSFIREIRGRKKAEDTLRESEERYRALFNSNTDSIFLADMESYRLVDANPAACRTYGYSRDEFLRLRVTDISAEPEKTIEAFRARVQFVTGRMHRQRDGSEFPIEGSYNYVSLNGRECSIVTIRDISRRKEAEQNLLEMRLQLEAIINSAMDAIITADESGRIILFNATAESMFGYTEAEVKDKNLEDLLPQDLRLQGREFLCQYKKRVPGALQPDSFQLDRALRRNGEEFPAEFSFSGTDVNGKKLFTLILRDITERKKNITILQEEKQRLELAIHSADFAIWDWDIQSGNVIFSDRWATMLGYEPGELKPGYDTWHRLVHPDDLPVALKALEKHLKDKLPFYRAEHRLRCKNGTWKWVLVSGKLISRDKDGRPRHVFGTHLDITDRKNSEEEIRKLALVAQKTDNAVIITDAAGIIEWVNSGFTQISGFTFDEAIGHKPGKLLQGPDTNPEAVKTMREAMRQGRGFELEILNYTKSRLPYWLHLSVNPVFDDSGALRQFVAIQRDITERKKAEEQLHFQASVLQSVKDSVITTDLQGHITYFNKGAEAIFGYSAAEMTGRSPLVLYPEAYGEKLSGDLRLIMEGQDYNGEWKGRRKDNSLVWVNIKTSLLRDAAGNPTGLLGVAKDITDRKQAEAKLRQSEANLQAIFDASVQTYFLLDKDYRILKFNSTSARFIRQVYDRELREGDCLLDFSDPASVEDFKKNLARAFSGEKVVVTRRINQPKGLKMWVEVQYLPAYDTSENIYAVAFVSLDITDRKQAEAKLRESEANLRSIFDASVQTYFLLDPSYRILNFNRAAAGFIRQVYGIELREGDNILNLVDPKTVTDIRRNVSRAFGGEKVVVTLQVDHPGHPGMWVEDQFLPAYDDEGQVFAVAFVSLNVTDRKRAEEAIMELNAGLEQRVSERTVQLEAINRELEAFSYSVSHDLRAPLRTIDGFSKAVLEDYQHQLDEEGRENLQSIRNATRQMGLLINDLLKLSKITRGEMYCEPVDLTALVLDIEQELRGTEPDRKVCFRAQSDMQVKADPRLLRIAMQNILQNAWKFSSRREEAIIEAGSLEQAGRQVYFVRDNGAGFNQKYAGKLFGAFQRLHAAAEFEGTGIGLATVYRIISRHGGRIWADSAVDIGTTFFFTLSPDHIQPISNG